MRTFSENLKYTRNHSLVGSNCKNPENNCPESRNLFLTEEPKIMLTSLMCWRLRSVEKKRGCERSEHPSSVYFEKNEEWEVKYEYFPIFHHFQWFCSGKRRSFYFSFSFWCSKFRVLYSRLNEWAEVCWEGGRRARACAGRESEWVRACAGRLGA